jgi:hypothetical protein
VVFVSPAVHHFILRLLTILLIGVGISIAQPQSEVLKHRSVAASSSVSDPDIADSEFNHHCAGYILVAVALLMLAGEGSPKLRFTQAIWPLLFVAAGLFLAVWSDKEIWPRGFLSWTWLLHHDAEARQHKIYGLLLLALGAIEYSRWRQKLPRMWEIWTFPVLAALGAVLLLFHPHGGSSGLPAGWDKLPTSQKAVLAAAIKRGDLERVAASNGWITADFTHDGQPSTAAVHHLHMAHGSGMEAGMEASASEIGSEPAKPNPGLTSAVSHMRGHTMTPAMLLIKREHFWYTLVGLTVALFKFVADGRFWPARPVRCLWPGAMTLLGVLLILYRE